MTPEREAELRAFYHFSGSVVQECLDAIARMREAMRRDGQIIEHLTLEVGTQVLTVERMRSVVEAVQAFNVSGDAQPLIEALYAYEEAENGRS